MKALELAKVHGSEVEILHVMTFSEDVPKETTETGSPPEWVEDYVSRVRKNDENMLNSALEESKRMAPGIMVNIKLLLGKPASMIVGEAAYGGFDLIVIGSRGLSGVRELVLGSVSHQVVNESKVPVLVVK
jgi:nucleotide-binding universal stress UspA family protein